MVFFRYFNRATWNIIVEISKFSLGLSNCLHKTINQRTWIRNRADHSVAGSSLSLSVSLHFFIALFAFCSMLRCLLINCIHLIWMTESGNRYVFIFMWHQFNELLLCVVPITHCSFTQCYGQQFFNGSFFRGKSLYEYDQWPFRFN